MSWVLLSFSKIVSWVKENPIYGLAAALAPIVGLLAGLSGAMSSVAQVLGRPPCWTYSDVYYYYNGHFRNMEDKWVEFQPRTKMIFNEISRNQAYIILLNKTPRDDPRWESMLVRLPVCGGTAQWTEENPERWSDLFQVTRNVSPQMAVIQQRYEQP